MWKVSFRKAGTLFYNAGIPLGQDKFFQCNRFSSPKRDEKFNISVWKIQRSTFQYIEEISFAFLGRIWHQSVRKKVSKCLYRILSFKEKKNKLSLRLNNSSKTFLNQRNQLTCLRRKIKRKYMQIPDGKISRLTRTKFNFPM